MPREYSGAHSAIADFLAGLPRLLKTARENRGLSQRAAARQIGISFSTVSRVEAGEDMALASAVAILRWLDI